MAAPLAPFVAMSAPSIPAVLAAALLVVVPAHPVIAQALPGEEPATGLLKTDGPEPWIHVDGVRIDPSAGVALYASLDPDDIERIEVVKREAAIANFGEDATSGVVQIFTKTGAGTEAETVYFSEPSGEGEEPAQFRVRRPGGAPVAELSREVEFGTKGRLRLSGSDLSDMSNAKMFVDGERVSSLEDIHPEDVERMDVIVGGDGDEIQVTLKRSASSGGL